MQGKKVTNHQILISVPIEVILESEIYNEGVLQFRAEKGKIIIEGVKDVGDIVCGNDCEECPLYGSKDCLKYEEENELGR